MNNYLLGSVHPTSLVHTPPCSLSALLHPPFAFLLVTPPPPPSQPRPPIPRLFRAQVDGPSHFVELVGGGRRPNGATRLKWRLLGRAGCRVVSVPYWEWDASRCAGPVEQAACLRRLLQGSVALR